MKPEENVQVGGEAFAPTGPVFTREIESASRLMESRAFALPAESAPPGYIHELAMGKPCTRCEKSEAQHPIDVAWSDAYGMDLCDDCLEQFQRLMDVWMDEVEANTLMALYYNRQAGRAGHD